MEVLLRLSMKEGVTLAHGDEPAALPGGESVLDAINHKAQGAFQGCECLILHKADESGESNYQRDRYIGGLTFLSS